MGVEAGKQKRRLLLSDVAGDCDKGHRDYDYFGNKDCGMMPFVPGGGPKSCNHGCLGYGNCVKACPFDVIHIINGIAKVDENAFARHVVNV